MAAEKASTSTPGMRTYTPTLLTTISPTSAASLPGRGPLKKEPQLNPSSSCEDVDMGLVVLLLLGVVLVLRPAAGVMVVPLPLLLLLPDGLGGASGTLGCVSVSESAAATRINLLLVPVPMCGVRHGRRLLLLNTGVARVAAGWGRAAARTLLPCSRCISLKLRPSAAAAFVSCCCCCWEEMKL